VRQRVAEVAEREVADGRSAERVDVAGRRAAASGKWHAPTGGISGLYVGWLLRHVGHRV